MPRLPLPLALLLAAPLLLLTSLRSNAFAGGDCEPEKNPTFQRAARLLEEAEKTGSIEAAKGAAALLVHCEEQCPDTPWYPMYSGIAHVFGKSYEGAQAASRRLRQILVTRARELNRPQETVDGDPKLLFLDATISLYLGWRPGDAVRSLERARAKDPGFLRDAVTIVIFRALLAWAKQFADQRNWGEAIQATKRAISEASRDVEPTRRDQAKRNLAQLYRGADSWKESQDLWLELLASYPDDVIVRYGLAGTYADQYQYSQAIVQYRAILKLIAEKKVTPADLAQIEEIRMRFGVCLVFDTKVEEGRKELLAYLETHKEEALPCYYLGQIAWEQLAKPAEARTWAEKARALDPWCEKTLRLLLNIYSNGFADDPEAQKKAKEIGDLLSNEGAKAERLQEMERRRKARSDSRDGCT